MSTLEESIEAPLTSTSLTLQIRKLFWISLKIKEGEGEKKKEDDEEDEDEEEVEE